MTFFNDFRAAIDSYDSDSVDVKIQAFQLYGAGSKLDTGEWFRFQIAVFNQGHIDMRNITVRIYGSNYAKVSLVYGGVSNSVDLKFSKLDAHHSAQSGAWIYGKATQSTGGTAKDVVSARIAYWDASLDHLLLDHSNWGPVEAKVNIKIESD